MLERGVASILSVTRRKTVGHNLVAAARDACVIAEIRRLSTIVARPAAPSDAGTWTPYTLLLSTPGNAVMAAATSELATFSPFQRNVSPIRSRNKSSRLVHPHKIASAVPGIATLEHIGRIFRSESGAGVALETAARSRFLIPNSADRFADFVYGAANTKPMLVAIGSPAAESNWTKANGKRCARNRRDAADRANLAFHIVKRNVALGWA